MTGRGAAPPRTEAATNEPARTEPARSEAERRAAAASGSAASGTAAGGSRTAEPDRAARGGSAPPGPAPAPPEAPQPIGRPAPGSTGASAPSDEPDSFIPDGVALGFGDIPEGFWDAPADEVRAALTADEAPAPPTPPPTAPRAEAEPPPALEEAEPPTPLEEAFDQLQSLFPGRVVEVQPRGVESADEAETSPLEDDFPPEGGYDDEGQERLSFGPQEDA